jgi:putative ABC transport system permease protein
MLTNDLRSSWRNLIKNKTFSLIHIAGLSIGMAVCFLIMLYVHHELSFDKFNVNADRIVRIAFDANINGGQISESNVMPPVAAAMKSDYPEVQESARLKTAGYISVIIGDKIIRQQKLGFIDPSFFTVFTLPFISGDQRTALVEPQTIVLTESAAKRIFGNTDPIGKLISINDRNNQLRVTGIIKDIPGTSHFQFDMLGSMSSIPDSKSDSWMRSDFYTYLLLKPGTSVKALEAKLPHMVEKYMGPQIQQVMGISLAQFRTKGNRLGFLLQPLTSIHLYARSNAELLPSGNVMYVYIFSVIAMFMLVVAAINFINLSTAGAYRRAKEVGIRKVIGSGKWALIRLFLTESTLLVFLSLLVSVEMVKLALPLFNELSGKDLKVNFNLNIILAFAGLGVVVSLLSGIYPAVLLSTFNPVKVLKGKITGGFKGFSLRSSLVVFQFFISVALVIGAIVVWQQMRYIQKKQLGYNKEAIMVLPNSYTLGKNETVYKDMLKKDPRIENITVSFYRPAGPTNSNNALAYPEGRENEMMRTVEFHIDENYIPTFDMQMAAGRNFSSEMHTDSTALIINETAAKSFGWDAQSALGKTIIRQNSYRGTNVPFHVVGVVRDFHFKSLHEPITPLLMAFHTEGGLILKVKTAEIQSLIADMKKQWDGFNTVEPFNYQFLDELYSQTYTAEQKTGTILNIFTVLTILVACLGLFGLATYMAEQRTKEIGVRKVLGASVMQVVGMLSKDLLKLVMIACVVAFPLAYWAMHMWLESFAYRINISWTVFAIAMVVALMIALITISFQSVRAALANPVKSLRSE